MDWLTQMNYAIDYIEENLENEIDYVEVSKKACCSVYHFQRMFSYMASVGLSEYVRRRRLACAAFELQNTNDKIIDISCKYGYDSPTAFTRAFKNMHGISPSDARKNGVMIKAYPPISFQITIKGAVEMEYRIEDKEAFRTVGIKLQTTIDNEECYKEVPKFWSDSIKSGMIGQVASLMNIEPFGLLGISSCNAISIDSEFDYYIAVSSTSQVKEGMYEFIVPKATWAIFECVGLNNLVDMQKRIVTEWLPTSGYEYADAPDIEVYLDEASKPDARCEIWLPVKKQGGISIE